MTSRNIVPVALANSATQAAVAYGKGMIPVGVYIPVGFSGTAITFNIYTADGQHLGLMSDGAGGSYTRTVRAGDYVPLSRDLFAGIDGLQVISGTSQSGAVNLLVAFTPA